MSTADLKTMKRHREPPFWTHPQLGSSQPEQRCGQGCDVGDVPLPVDEREGDEPDDGEGDEGHAAENEGNANGEWSEDEEEQEPLVNERFETATLMLTRMKKLLEREQPWSSRPFIEAFLRSNRQNLKLLEDDDKRLARQTIGMTWQNNRNPASMYLRGEEPV
ncbi:hypothetical protein CF327_g6166 [Tilletia walkeri]|nr:hypothetical protein CF327_g6166 [Tilletia walkeri]